MAAMGKPDRACSALLWHALMLCFDHACILVALCMFCTRTSANCVRHARLVCIVTHGHACHPRMHVLWIVLPEYSCPGQPPVCRLQGFGQCAGVGRGLR